MEAYKEYLLKLTIFYKRIFRETFFQENSHVLETFQQNYRLTVQNIYFELKQIHHSCFPRNYFQFRNFFEITPQSETFNILFVQRLQVEAIFDNLGCRIVKNVNFLDNLIFSEVATYRSTGFFQIKHQSLSLKVFLTKICFEVQFQKICGFQFLEFLRKNF